MTTWHTHNRRRARAELRKLYGHDSILWALCKRGLHRRSAYPCTITLTVSSGHAADLVTDRLEGALADHLRHAKPIYYNEAGRRALETIAAEVIKVIIR